MKRIGLLIVSICCSICGTYSQGQIWGVTQNGGTNGDGTVYRTNTDGSNHFVQKSFTATFTGGLPYSKLTQANNGKLYGTTTKGGNFNHGTIIEFDPITNVFTKKFDFNAYSEIGSATTVVQSLTRVPSGKLYGRTSNAIFEFDPITNIYQTKFIFPKSSGGQPLYTPPMSFVLASNNKLYAVSQTIEGLSDGAVFEYDIATASLTRKLDLAPHGIMILPQGDGMILAPNGKLYGTALEYSTGKGVLYEYDISLNTLTKKVSNLSYGASMIGIAVTPGGKIYGATNKASLGDNGFIYEFDLNTNTYTQKYAFGQPSSDGAYTVGLIVASNGKVYGVTTHGGLGTQPSASNSYNGYGILFEFDPINNTFVKKIEFQDFNSTGIYPRGSIMQASDGMIYGTASNQSSVLAGGTIFQFNPVTNIFVKKFSFLHFSDAKSPVGGIVKHSNGRFYGLSTVGGFSNTGSLFGFDLGYTPPTSTIKFTFSTYMFGIPIPNSIPGTHGSYPIGPLVVGISGYLYGVTSQGGTNGYGDIFKFLPGVDLSTSSTPPSYDFTFDHSVPGSQCGLMLASNGKMYGMTSKGGTNNVGTIYEYDGTTVTIRYNFNSLATGSTPFGNLIQGVNGKLYGMTYAGGVNNHGVIFEFDPVTFVVTKRFDFSSATSGANPRGNLIQATNGKLYGMTSYGGANNKGVLFEYDLTLNAFTKKFDFNGTNGANPYGTLVQSPNGKLYGTTYNGGANDLGVTFEFDFTTNSYTKKLDFNGANGANPVGPLYYDQLPKSVQTITFSPLTIQNQPWIRQLNDPPFVAATASSGLPVAIVSSNPSVATVSGNIVTLVGTGVTEITASQTGNSAYYPAISIRQNLYVNKAVLTVTPANSSRNYGAANPAFTLSYTGFVNGDNASVIDVPPTVTTSATSFSPVGNYSTTPSGGSDNNYSFNFVNGILSVNKATLIATSNATKVYGSTNPSFTISYTGFVNSESPSVIDSPPIASSLATELSSVGTYPITLTGGIDNNYHITNQSGSLTVTKKNLTTTVANASRYVGQSNPMFNISYSGFVNGENSSVLDVQSLATTTANVSSPPGNYPITVSGGSDNNYSFTYGNGVLTVLAAPTPTCSFYISPTGDLCADGRISLRVVSTDGTPSSYAWSTGETIGRILVYSSGYYSVTVNYTNECSKTQSIYIDPPTGSGCLFYLKAEPLKFLQTTEYPNPVDGELSVEVDNNLLVGSDEVQIALIDQSGRVAFSSNFKTEFNKIKINTSNMPSGLYLLQIGTTKTGVVRKKIMVTH